MSANTLFGVRQWCDFIDRLQAERKSYSHKGLMGLANLCHRSATICRPRNVIPGFLLIVVHEGASTEHVEAVYQVEDIDFRHVRLTSWIAYPLSTHFGV